MKTLGEFYREFIVGRDDLTLREFLEFNGGCEVVKDLFGWKLYSGKHSIECRSGEEARFLKVFLEAGMHEVSVPSDDNYLKQILPELERLKKRTDEIIGLYVDGVLSSKIKERVRHEVYQELIKL
jgi:hypothetical protein